MKREALVSANLAILLSVVVFLDLAGQIPGIASPANYHKIQMAWSYGLVVFLVFLIAVDFVLIFLSDDDNPEKRINRFTLGLFWLELAVIIFVIGRYSFIAAKRMLGG